jgi:hypothetical protein
VTGVVYLYRRPEWTLLSTFSQHARMIRFGAGYLAALNTNATMDICDLRDGSVTTLTDARLKGWDSLDYSEGTNLVGSSLALCVHLSDG